MSTPSTGNISDIIQGLDTLQQLCGETAASKGFHDDRPDREDYPVTGGDDHAKALANWQGNKLMLVVSEVVEAHDELRKGFPADLTYHPTDYFGAPEGPHKPEGVPSEIADAVIRCFDFAYTEGFDLAAIILEKIEYNATRERLHGKKF